MMQEEDMAERNKVLVVKVGSNLYGTNDENSDEDYVGIFIADLPYYFGMHHIKNINLDKQIKDERGKNTKDSKDVTFYEIRKFFKLAIANNPNIIEIFFAPENCIVYANGVGQKILESYKHFIHKELFLKFLGYANSQKHKLRIKREHFHSLNDALNFFNSLSENDLDRLIVEFDEPFIVKKDHSVKIGDLYFPKGKTIRKLKSKIEERLSKFTNRKELILAHGYDSKFAYHLIRLLIEAEELLKTKRLRFPLVDAPMLKRIKHGHYSLEDVLESTEELEKQVQKAYEESKLPKTVNFDAIENILIECIRTFHGI